MASLIPGYEYDIFISYRQKKKEGVIGRVREGVKYFYFTVGFSQRFGT